MITETFANSTDDRDRAARLMRSGGFYPDHFLDDGSCPKSYFDTPLPETARTVTRVVADGRSYTGICSTYNPTTRVTLPRISMVDGPYRPHAKRSGANDNNRAGYRGARHAEQGGRHAAA